MTQISIITAVHNGLPINRLFLDYIRRYTSLPYELIIIDNASSDGSGDYFARNKAIVISNSQNYSYPHAQNQGIHIASGEYLCFLNNDLLVSPGWDQRLIDTALRNDLDILSACGLENMGNRKDTVSMKKKWKRIKYAAFPFGYSYATMGLMTRLMYGNWERFCQKRYHGYGTRVVEGIVGDNVLMTRRAFERIGLWDERIQAADFDLFMRSKKRSLDIGDIRPAHLALGIYMHHFGRMTVKYGTGKPAPFFDGDSLIPLSAKWNAAELEDLHPNKATLLP